MGQTEWVKEWTGGKESRIEQGMTKNRPRRDGTGWDSHSTGKDSSARGIFWVTRTKNSLNLGILRKGAEQNRTGQNRFET